MKIANIKQILINVLSRIILENIKVNSNIEMMAEMFMIVLIKNKGEKMNKSRYT